MAGKFDLITTLTLNAMGYDNGIDKAKRKTQELEATAKKVGGAINSALSFVGIGAGIAGAMTLIKSSIASVEGPGDKMAASMAGVKESLFELQRAIGTMNFTDLLDNLREGFNRGKELEEALDALEDRKGYSDYVIIGLQQESEALRETTKNKQLDIKTRAEAADKILDIEEKIFNRKKDIIAQTYDVEKMSWEGRNKMAIDEGVKLFENMNKIQKEGYNNISAEQIKRVQELYDGYIEAQKLIGGSIKKIAEGGELLLNANLLGKGNYDFVKDIPKEDLAFIADTFSRFTIASESGESGIWKKLFETINANTKSIVAAQTEYNSAIKETTTLLAKEEAQTASAAVNVRNKVSPISPLSVGNIDIPTLAAPFNPDTPLKKKDVEGELALIKHNQALQEAITLQEELNAVEDYHRELWLSMNDIFAEGAETFKEYGKSVKGAIKQVIGALIAEGVATMITAALKTAKFSGPAALIVAPALAALGAGIAKTAFNSLIPNFAEGGLLYGAQTITAGEYPGARSNPEVVAPLNKLKTMINGGGIGGGEVLIKFQNGSLEGYMNYQNRKINSYA